MSQPIAEHIHWSLVIHFPHAACLHIQFCTVLAYILFSYLFEGLYQQI